jgi:hypothetical protein
VVADAVQRNQSLKAKFRAKREIYREFLKFRRSFKRPRCKKPLRRRHIIGQFPARLNSEFFSQNREFLRVVSGIMLALWLPMSRWG